ncbi:MAG TPA: hypothetical protein VEQ59_23830, partial [Polyangiaceae bacterium]|nr:hypothetical protein [Polyangiaceae bacterium]
MSKLLKSHETRGSQRAHWAWLVPILALSPLALAAKGCDNAGVSATNAQRRATAPRAAPARDLAPGSGWAKCAEACSVPPAR